MTQDNNKFVMLPIIQTEIINTNTSIQKQFFIFNIIFRFNKFIDNLYTWWYKFQQTKQSYL